WLPELASAWALHALRAYDLVGGAERLRAVGWCASPSALTRTSLRRGLEFLLLQQRPEGDFGFLAPELRAGGCTPDSGDERTLRLTVTVQCLWTLSECGPEGWRLLPALREVAGLVLEPLAAPA